MQRQDFPDAPSEGAASNLTQIFRGILPARKKGPGLSALSSKQSPSYGGSVGACPPHSKDSIPGQFVDMDALMKRGNSPPSLEKMPGTLHGDYSQSQLRKRQSNKRQNPPTQIDGEIAKDVIRMKPPQTRTQTSLTAQKCFQTKRLKAPLINPSVKGA